MYKTLEELVPLQVNVQAVASRDVRTRSLLSGPCVLLAFLLPDPSCGVTLTVVTSYVLLRKSRARNVYAVEM